TERCTSSGSAFQRLVASPSRRSISSRSAVSSRSLSSERPSLESSIGEGIGGPRPAQSQPGVDLERRAMALHGGGVFGEHRSLEQMIERQTLFAFIPPRP